MPNQRQDSNCTVPRHLDTDHISHGGVAVSITLCSCVPHTAQQCCSAFLTPKNVHHLAKKKARTACVVLPVCFSSAAKCSWSSVLNFKSVFPAPCTPSLFVCQMCWGHDLVFLIFLSIHRPPICCLTDQHKVLSSTDWKELSLPEPWHYKMLG